MADIKVRRAHGLSLEDAQAKIDQVVADVQSEFSNLVSSIDWNDEKTEAKVKGKGFTGDFLVNEDEVGIDINLSMFAKPLKGKVQKKIEERVDQYFA
jgi:putative polyhydroxyalkanoate system protein